MIIKDKIANNDIRIFFVEADTPRMSLRHEVDGATKEVTVYARGPKKDLKRWYDNRIKKKFKDKDGYDKLKLKSKNPNPKRNE
jgi:hypothetical protein